MGAGAFGALGSAGAGFPLSDLLCSLIPDGCGLCVRSLPRHPRLESVARGSSAGQCPPDVAQPGCALPVHGCSGPTMAWEAAWAAPFPGASLASPAPCGPARSQQSRAGASSCCGTGRAGSRRFPPCRRGVGAWRAHGGVCPTSWPGRCQPPAPSLRHCPALGAQHAFTSASPCQGCCRC